MTIELKPEDAKLVEEKLRTGGFRSDELIHRALVSLPTRDQTSEPPRQNLAEFLKNSPFAGAELDLERRKQYVPPVEL